MLTYIQSLLTLNALDEPWRKTLQSSLLLRPFFAVKEKLPSIGIANVLQMLGMLITFVLFGALGLHQFTNDKNGLAIIALSGFAFWLFGYLLGGKQKRTPTAIDALVLLYFAANIIATGASHYFDASLYGLSKVAVFIATYFYLTAILQQNPTLTRMNLMRLLTISGFVLSIYGFWQYKMHVQPLATWEDPTVESQGTRIFATLDNPNLLAGYLLPLVALSASLAMAEFSRNKWILGVPIICSTLAMAVATVLTGSRGGYLALFATIGIFAFLGVATLFSKFPKHRLLIIGGIVALGAVALVALTFVPGFQQRITSILHGSEHSSNAYRINVWRSSFEMLKGNWWYGIGPGNKTFVLAYGLYMTSGFDALGTYCVPLEVAVETGLIGFAAFFMMIVAVLCRGHFAFWDGKGFERWLAAGAAAALMALMVQGLVDTVFYRPQVHFLFWLVIAMLAVGDNKAAGNGEKA